MNPSYISAKQMRKNFDGNVFSPMGCMSFLPPWKNENGEYCLEGRFNQGVVSINVPQIGIIANGDLFILGGKLQLFGPSTGENQPIKKMAYLELKEEYFFMEVIII